NNIDTTWNQRTADMQQKVAQSDSVINGLKEENQKLKNELIVAQKKVSAANLQLDDKQRTIIMQWFMYGGGVLGIGLLLGLVLPHMIVRSIAEEIAARRHQHRCEVLTLERVRANAIQASALNVNESDVIFHSI
ncbi:SH3 domain-containing protein, partial [Salmonella enterica subsp. enterica serovar Heidelberg str. SARA32]